MEVCSGRGRSPRALVRRGTQEWQDCWRLSSMAARRTAERAYSDLHKPFSHLHHSPRFFYFNVLICCRVLSSFSISCCCCAVVFVVRLVYFRPHHDGGHVSGGCERQLDHRGARRGIKVSRGHLSRHDVRPSEAEPYGAYRVMPQ